MTFKHPDLVELKERSGDPTAIANTGFVYAKDLGGVTQLYYMNQAGTVIPLGVAATGTPRGTLVQAGRPAVTNSATEGFQAGDRIFDTNTNVSWVCRDALAGNPWWVPENAAGWKQKVTLTAYAKLIAWWDLDESNGPALDRLLRLNGRETVSGPYALAGKTCERARNVTSSQYFLCGNPEDFYPSAFHIVAWLNLNNKANYKMILAQDDGTNTVFDFSYDSVQDKFYIQVTTDGTTTTTKYATTFGSPSISTWYFVDAYWDGANLGIAVNDGVHDTIAFAGPIYNAPANGNTPIGIGCRTAGSFPLDGLLQSVGLFNAKLTAAELTAIYNAGSGVRMLGYGAP